LAWLNVLALRPLLTALLAVHASAYQNYCRFGHARREMGKAGTAAVGQLATRTLAESAAVSRDKVKMATWTGNAPERNWFMNTRVSHGASVMVHSCERREFELTT
jgi:hypothetical protein